jgi:hypothetical protein
MHTFTNDQGQTVYRIERITDLALLPGDVLDRNDVFKQMEFFVLNLRLLLASAESEDHKTQLVEAIPSYVEFVDDGETSASFGCEDIQEVLYRARLIKET